MPTQILPTTGPGTNDQWGFVGADTAWQAVARGSGDASYIEAVNLFTASDFFCGNGTKPPTGRIVGITLHYRMRSTVPASGATVTFYLFQAGFPHVVSLATPVTNTWTEGSIRVRDSWSSPGTRPNLSDVVALGVGATIWASPFAGTVQISELWAEVEVLDTPYCYDPVDGSLPDAIVGPLQWTTAGTQPVSLTIDKYLEIIDTDPIDFRVYSRSLPDSVNPYFTTEIETRLTVTTAAVGDIHLGIPAGLANQYERIYLSLIRVSGQTWIGLAIGSLGDLSSYLAAAQVDLLGQDIHLRLVVDRDDIPETYGQVKVFLNYQEAPLLQVDYADFLDVAPPLVPGVMWFGDQSLSQSTVRYDYWTVKHYKKRRGEFKGWEEWDLGPNRVSASTADPDIVRPVLINPPGVMAGQSSCCGILDVLDPTLSCEVYQTIFLPEALPITYGVALDYKVVSPVPQSFELVIQRMPDLWYWDQGTSSWVAAYASVAVPFSLTRTRLALITGMGLVVPEMIRISVQGTLAPALPHQIMIYKVYLQQE